MWPRDQVRDKWGGNPKQRNRRRNRTRKSRSPVHAPGRFRALGRGPRATNSATARPDGHVGASARRRAGRESAGAFGSQRQPQTGGGLATCRHRLARVLPGTGSNLERMCPTRSGVRTRVFDISPSGPGQAGPVQLSDPYLQRRVGRLCSPPAYGRFYADAPPAGSHPGSGRQGRESDLADRRVRPVR
jgi:hypothetical protein